MNKFFDDNYLLTSDSAREIYSEIRDLPIFDYHSHLSPKEIYEDKEYDNIAELWLGGDHYKWRLMREAGIDEKYICGDAKPYDKFLAFAEILPLFLGNPVYEWAHLELKRYFDMNIPINRANAKEIWDRSYSIIHERHYSPRKLLEMANVTTLMTTDDPLDNLQYHEKLRVEHYSIELIPTFRADRVLGIEKADFEKYINDLSSATGVDIVDVKSVAKALAMRLDYFVNMGSTIADLSILNVPKNADITIADETFRKAMSGQKLDADEIDAYVFNMLVEIGRMMSERDIVMQVHIGAVRNVNTRRFNLLGADSGIDSIADAMSVERLGVLMDVLDKDNHLPRSIYYSHNASVFYPLSCMINNFAGDVRGKVQLGAAWWMMDSRDGIRYQLEVFKNTAGLGYFNGMLTDSRSFTSFVRHDYFRRVLSSVIGDMVESGAVQFDENTINIAKNIAYYNAKSFF